jgi:hypothetical protein
MEISHGAKLAKLAKALPLPPFFNEMYLGVLRVLCARSYLLLSSDQRKNLNVFG